MENENIPNSTDNTIDDTSLDKSVQVEQILEFYKDKQEQEEVDTAEIEVKPQNKLASSYSKISQKIPYLKKFSDKKDNKEISLHTYGLGEKQRQFLTYIITALVCIAIISGSVVLAMFLPSNKATFDEKAAQLRAQDDYTNLKSRYDSLKEEAERLEKENEDKKLYLESVNDFENTKAKLRTEISEKALEYNELNAQITQKRDEIAQLDKSISEKAPPDTVLPPGKYIVGTNIAAGSYFVTGSGKFMVASSKGKSKLNTTLSSTPLEISLDAGDVVKFDGKVKFSAAY